MPEPSQEQQNAEIGYVKPREISEEMKASYIDYAMSVIVSRALPDVRDGLKPVHRRILYTMLEEGLRHDAKFRKSATVVGSCLGKYHPHGDQAVYDAAMRMAQDFSLRYPLVQGQGNVGSIDDPSEFAAMRYTEMRLSKIGEEMLRDIQKETVDFMDNYDATRKEPVVLPSPLPQLLLNGTMGIAVGMATNIPPHNLSELVDAAVYLLFHSKATSQDLFQFIKGPDFPTGGFAYDQKGIIAVYSQGRGPIVTRGRAEIMEQNKGTTIIVEEIPFQVRKAGLLEQFAKLVQQKKLEGIKDIRDESDKEGMRIVLELHKTAFPQKILNRLYKFSDLQKTFHLNMLALVDGLQPKVLSLAEALNCFLLHREVVLTRRLKYDLEKAEERAHILQGLVKCLSCIDAVIKTIKTSKSRGDAQKNLMKKFKLTEIQAEAILETKLSALARLEREKLAQELAALLKQIKELSVILKSPQKIKQVLQKELEALKEKFGDKRRTRVWTQKAGEIAEEDLIPQEETIVTLTQGGYIKRIDPRAYRIQKRGGKGILGLTTSGQDIVEHFLCCQTHDDLLFFTDSGKVFRTKVYEIPLLPRVAKGRGLANFLDISSNEKILSLFALGKEDKDMGITYLIFVTKNGIIKKTGLTEFENVRRSGLIAITLKKGDLLRRVAKSTGQDEIILVSKKGQALRLQEKELRPMGRQAAGVRGIRLKKGPARLASQGDAGGDEVIGMEIIKKEKLNKNYLLVISEQGYGKRTEVKHFKTQKRGGVGIKAAKIPEKTGNLIALRLLTGREEDLIVISQKGQVIRMKVGLIPVLGRVTQGVKIMNLQGDKVASAACI